MQEDREPASDEKGSTSESSEPLAIQSSNSIGTRRIVLIGVVGLAIGGLAVWYAVQRSRSNEPHAEKPSQIRPQPSEPLKIPAELRNVRQENPGYVGAAACAECHAARLEEFRGTRHYIACWGPDEKNPPPGFSDPQARLSSPYWPYDVQLEAQGNQFVEHVVGKKPTQRIDERHRIDLIYGAGGKGDEIYFTWRGNRLFEMPLAWLHPSNCWGKQNYGMLGDEVLRTTTPRCLECHTTYFEHVLGTENEYYRDTIMPGVTCERCHGPARDHVEHHRANPGLKEGAKIVHPGRLPRDRQIDVCGQCHSPALHHRDELFSFRPGDNLDDHFYSLQVEGIEDDHVTNQVKYLKRSKCFQQDETLACQTCHNPHQKSDPREVSAACAKCHQPTNCGSNAALPEAVRDRCVDCHMPSFNRVVVNFRTATDEYVFPVRPHEHRIAVYPRATQEVLRDWHARQDSAEHQAEGERLTRELAAAWTGVADELRSNHRHLAALGAYREAMRFNANGEARTKLLEVITLLNKIDDGRRDAAMLISQDRVNEAITKLKQLLELAPNQAAVHGRLGTLYERTGQHAKALESWAAVNKYNPDDPYGHNMRGWTAYLRGDFDEAIDGLREADRRLPFTAEINYRWGLAALGKKDAPMAIDRLRIALRVNPNHAGAMQAISHALRAERKFTEAVPYAATAAERSNFANFDVLVSWIDACLDARRFDDASQAIELAKPLVVDANSKRLIEERLQRVTERR